MVIYTKVGLEKIKAIINGTLSVGLTGNIAEFVDELSIILTKLNFVANEVRGFLTVIDGLHTIGTSDSKEVIPVEELFSYFGCTAATLDAKDRVGSSKLLYYKDLAEPLHFNPVTKNYMANDGSTYDASVIADGGSAYIKEDLLGRYMPDLAKELKNSDHKFKALLKKKKLVGLDVGSRVVIQTYTEMAKKFGDVVITIFDDMPVFVETSDDPMAIRLIQELVYSSVSGTFYDNKEATVIGIDKLTGALLLDIEGLTTHTKYVDEDGTVSDTDSDDAVTFTIDMIKFKES